MNMLEVKIVACGYGGHSRNVIDVCREFLPHDGQVFLEIGDNVVAIRAGSSIIENIVEPRYVPGSPVRKIK